MRLAAVALLALALGLHAMPATHSHRHLHRALHARRHAVPGPAPAPHGAAAP